MDFYFGLAQVIGVHTLLGLSAYIVLLTGQVSLAQAGFYAIGAYVAGMLTVLGGWHLVPALGASAVCGAAVACAVGFPALRVKGLMLVIATLAFGEGVRLFFFNFDYQIAKGDLKVGPLGGEGFRQIRFFPENGWSTFEAMFNPLWIAGLALLLVAVRLLIQPGGPRTLRDRATAAAAFAACWLVHPYSAVVVAAAAAGPVASEWISGEREGWTRLRNVALALAPAAAACGALVLWQRDDPAFRTLLAQTEAGRRQALEAFREAGGERLFAIASTSVRGSHST